MSHATASPRWSAWRSGALICPATRLMLEHSERSANTIARRHEHELPRPCAWLAYYAARAVARRAGFRPAPTLNPLNGSCLTTTSAMAIASPMASSETLPSHSRTISCHVRPRSSCSKTIHTMMRVPLNVGWPPQIFESAMICRPNSTRRQISLAFAFMSIHHTMRPPECDCKRDRAGVRTVLIWKRQLTQRR